MTKSQKTYSTSFILFLTVFLTLFLMSASPAKAQLVIDGSRSMSVGSSQTLTATGGSGNYDWALAEGGGSLSGSNGASVTYTAPATNPNCQLNAKVCVTDSAGKRYCKWIAVNGYISNNTAYRIQSCFKYGGGWHNCLLSKL